jgi:hypothetical protein
MAWRSDTFAVAAKVAQNDAQKIDKAADKHRAAMTKVVKAAKVLANDRRTTLDQIKDPQLKRSAAR